MAMKIVARTKDPAAVALGRKGGKKGGPARAARLTAQQRSESARRAVSVRWDKVKGPGAHSAAANTATIGGTPKKATHIPVTTGRDTSDEALIVLLKRLKSAKGAGEVRRLSDQIERVIFHKQYENA